MTFRIANSMIRPAGAAGGPTGCVDGLWCSMLDVLDPAFVALSLGAFVVVAVGLTYVRRARDECADERGRLVAERDAFERFAHRVQAVEATPVQTMKSDGGDATLFQASNSDPRLDDVVDAYRETVMSVPHFEDDYDEGMAENLHAEFSDEVAIAITTGAQFTPQLKRALLANAVEAHRQRKRVIAAIDDELETLDDVAVDVSAVDGRLDALDDRPMSEKSYDELRETYEELAELERTCETLSDERQRTLTNGECGGTGQDGHEFLSYLYDPMDVTYPVLADVGELLGLVRRSKRRVRYSLSAHA